MIVAGFGFRAQASWASLADALALAGAPSAPDAFATLERKTDALASFAKKHKTLLMAISEKEAGEQITHTQSAASEGETGLGSVAEACALAAAGPGAKLLGPRVISSDSMATCAIAIGVAQP